MKIKLLSLFLILFVISCNTDKNENILLTENYINVAVFNGNGASPVCVTETLEALKIDAKIKGEEISGAEILSGKLSSFEAIIFPGGSGSRELNNLGKKGVDIVRSFVKDEGKGIIGICAGGYLMLSTKGYPSLQLSSVEHIDREHYNRGRGLVEFNLTEEGFKIFPELNDHLLYLQYYDGPVMQLKDSGSTAYKELGKFVTDITPDNFAPSGITSGSTFMFNEDTGKGKLFVISGHPESTPGMRWMVPRMVRWVSSNEQISYPDFFVRPELNDSVIMFDKALRKREKKLFWDLFNDTAEVQLAAMNELQSYRSRPAVRWNIGLLRDANPEVRKLAAYLLKETEYSASLPDLIGALETEKNEAVKKQLHEAIETIK